MNEIKFNEFEKSNYGYGEIISEDRAEFPCREYHVQSWGNISPD